MYGTGLGLERREGCIGKVQVREKRIMDRMGFV
jgi:hypothetical protein